MKRATEKAIVTVECVGCRSRRDIFPGQIAQNDVPMCSNCFMPMVPIKARAEREKEKRE